MTSEPHLPPDCARTRTDLVAFLDGELPPGEAQPVEAHLAACGACRAERQALAASWDLLDELAPVAARPGGLEEVERSILPPAQGRLLRWRPVRPGVVAWAAAAAALLLALGVSWAALRAPQEPSVAIQPDAPAPRLTPSAAPERAPRRTPAEEQPALEAPRRIVDDVPPSRAPQQEADDGAQNDGAQDDGAQDDVQTWDEVLLDAPAAGEEGEDVLEEPIGDEELEEVLDAALAAGGAELPPEDLDVVRNLELLVLLEAGETLDVIETLDLLEQLEEEEL